VRTLPVAGDALQVMLKLREGSGAADEGVLHLQAEQVDAQGCGERG